jgi:hypothetical protein
MKGKGHENAYSGTMITCGKGKIVNISCIPQMHSFAMVFELCNEDHPCRPS